MNETTRVPALMLLLSLLSTAVADDLIGAADLMELTAPPPDAVIAYGPDPLQIGKLRLPAGPGPHPVVAFIHGGCWLSRYDMSHAAAFEDGLARAGFAVWSLEYRRVGNEGGGWPNTYLDIAAGIDHLRTLAESQPLDLDRVVFSGHSAGGALALWAAARPRLAKESELYRPDPLPATAVVALAPAADLEAIEMRGSCGRVMNRLMGGSTLNRPQRYRDASPMKLVPIGVPQLLVVGTRDQAWLSTSLSYFHRARVLGEESLELVELPDSGHFEMIAPASSSWPRVLSTFRQALDGTGEPAGG